MKTLDILYEIEYQLGRITIANGYTTNIGQSVEYWGELSAEYDRDRLVFRDADGNPESFALNNKFHEARLPIEIEAISFTDNPKTTGANMFADILKAINAGGTWNGKAIDTNLVSRQTTVETAGKRAVRVLVEIEIVYRFPRWQVRG